MWYSRMRWRQMRYAFHNTQFKCMNVLEGRDMVCKDLYCHIFAGSAEGISVQVGTLLICHIRSGVLSKPNRGLLSPTQTLQYLITTIEDILNLKLKVSFRRDRCAVKSSNG